jgi:hypothetical protein
MLYDICIQAATAAVLNRIAAEKGKMGRANASGASTKSASYFTLIESAIKSQGADLCKKIGGTVQWDITGTDKKVLVQYSIDLKNAPGSVSLLLICAITILIDGLIF